MQYFYFTNQVLNNAFLLSSWEKNSIIMSFKEVGKACLFKNMVLLSNLLISKHLLKFSIYY